MQSITAGIDLAKHVFAICLVDAAGHVTGRRELRRDGFHQWLTEQPPGMVIAMEACGSAHYWARECQRHSLQPRLMAALFVKPSRTRALIKHDRQDAEAIATAARQGNMRFVAVKDEAQQVRLSWHRVREGYKKDALAVRNRLRGLLAEFGVVIFLFIIGLEMRPKRLWGLRKEIFGLGAAQVGLAELALSGCSLTSDHLYLFPNGARLDDTIAAVKSGEADAVFADRDALKPFSEGQDLVWAGENVTLDQGIGIGIRKSDTELKAKFDAAIESMKADGTLNTAIKKWFGEDADVF